MAASWLTSLPADFYDQLAHSLNLHGMAAAELLSRPPDEQLQQLAHLTGLTPGSVQRLNRISSHEELLATLEAEPWALYHVLLLGRLTLGTTLAKPVLAYVQQQMQISAEQVASLTAYCTDLSGAFLTTLEEHVPPPAGSVSLGLHRLRVEEAFARFLSDQPPAPAATLRLTEPQLHMLRLSLLLVHSLPQEADHPFLQGVAQMPRLQPAALTPLIEHLGQVQAQEPLQLTMPQLVQLYQAMQVCGMVFVSDVMSRIGLEDAFPILPITEAAPEAAPASSREVVGEMVSGFTRWVQHTFPDDPQVQQARAEVLRLANAL